MTMRNQNAGGKLLPWPRQALAQAQSEIALLDAKRLRLEAICLHEIRRLALAGKQPIHWITVPRGLCIRKTYPPGPYMCGSVAPESLRFQHAMIAEIRTRPTPPAPENELSAMWAWWNSGNNDSREINEVLELMQQEVFAKFVPVQFQVGDQRQQAWIPKVAIEQAKQQEEAAANERESANGDDGRRSARHPHSAITPGN